MFSVGYELIAVQQCPPLGRTQRCFGGLWDKAKEGPCGYLMGGFCRGGGS